MAFAMTRPIALGGVLRRALNTFVVRGPSVGSESRANAGGQLVRVTGFTGGYLPSKEDFMMIIEQAIRPEIKGTELVAPDVPSKFEDVFASFSSYPNRSGGGTVVFQLKSPELYARLPFARPLDPKARPQTLSDRTSWCGMLLPVLDNKIMPLDGFVLQKLQQRKQYSRMKWYSLIFSDYKPDLLVADGAKDDAVRDALKKHHPELTLSLDVKPKCVRSFPSENKVVLKFSSTSDLILSRTCLEAEGIKVMSMESERFNLRKAFLASQYRGVDNHVERPVHATEGITTSRVSVAENQSTGYVANALQPTITEEVLVTKIQPPAMEAVPVTKIQPPSMDNVLVTKIQPPPLMEPVLVTKIQPPSSSDEDEDASLNLAGGRRRGANRGRSSVSIPSSEEPFFERTNQIMEASEDSDDFYAIEERVSPFRYEYLSSNGPTDGGQQQASM